MAEPASNLRFRRCTLNDCGFLGELNHQLIHDEGHTNPMTVPELTQRMQNWLGIGLVAVVFENESGYCAYALFQEDKTRVYLRHFFVLRHCRRRGIGRHAIQLLRDKLWPKGKPVAVDVLVRNTAGMAFWHSVGFADYCLTLLQPAPSERA